jgi:hypothetical protein
LLPFVAGAANDWIEPKPTDAARRSNGRKPTLAAVALLHLKRTAAISAVESHLIERVNGG